MTFASIQSKKDLPNEPEALRNFTWDLLLAHHLLTDKYHLLQRQHFGRSSERLNTQQSGEADAIQEQLTELLAEAAATDQNNEASEESEAFTEVTSHKRRRKHHGRNAIPKELITDKVIDIADEQKTCPCCGRQKVVIDEKEHIVIERIPAQYKATRYIRPVYACSHCKMETQVADPVAATPIAKGLAGPALMCFVLLSKYAYHLPLYRIQRIIFHESGVWFTRSTLDSWVKRMSQMLQRLYREMLTAYRASRIKHADETPLPVRYKELCGKTHQGFMWVGVGCEQRLAVFWYNESRSSNAALEFLKGSGRGDYLMCDELGSYSEPVRAYGLKRQFCMMHARRKFFDAFKAGYKADYARRILRKIGHLYRLERFATRKELTTAQRGQLRKDYSSQLMSQLKKMLENPGFALLPQQLIGKAVNYLLNNWRRASRFLESGELPIDNGINERVLRALTIGRKNWMCAGSKNGAEWMAVFYTLIATCKLNGINLHEYLPETLMRLSIRPKGSDVSDLTPLEWLKSKNNGVLPPVQELYPDN